MPGFIWKQLKLSHFTPFFPSFFVFFYKSLSPSRTSLAHLILRDMTWHFTTTWPHTRAIPLHIGQALGTWEDLQQGRTISFFLYFFKHFFHNFSPGTSSQTGIVFAVKVAILPPCRLIPAPGAGTLDKRLGHSKVFNNHQTCHGVFIFLHFFLPTFQLAPLLIQPSSSRHDLAF